MHVDDINPKSLKCGVQGAAKAFSGLVLASLSEIHGRTLYGNEQTMNARRRCRNDERPVAGSK